MKISLSELEEFTKEMCDKYNVTVSIVEQGRHLDIYPPYGGSWMTEWYLVINNQKIFVGTDYNNTIDDFKSNIENIIKKNITYLD